MDEWFVLRKGTSSFARDCFPGRMSLCWWSLVLVLHDFKSCWMLPDIIQLIIVTMVVVDRLIVIAFGNDS